MDPTSGVYRLGLSGYQIAVVQLTPSGGFGYARQAVVNTEVHSNGISRDAAGNVYLSGYFTGTADFDPTVAGTYNIVSGGTPPGSAITGFLTKLAAPVAATVTGTVRDSANAGVAGIGVELVASSDTAYGGFDDFVQATAFTADNGTYTFTVPTPDLRYFVRFRTAPGYSGFTLPSGGPAVGVTPIFTLNPGQSLTGADAKFTTTQAAFGWATDTQGGSGGVRGNAIARAADGSLVVVGSFSGTTDFDAGSAVVSLTAAGSADSFVARYAPGGALLWVRNVGAAGKSSAGNAVAVDETGAVYVAGSFAGAADFDPGAGTFTLTATGSNANAYVWKLDSAGNFVWADQLGKGATAQALGLAVDGTTVYATGSFSGATGADFDPGAGVANLFATGGTDIFFSKLSRATGAYGSADSYVATAGNDAGTGVAVDAAGNAYVTGYLGNAAETDAFVFKVLPTGVATGFRIATGTGSAAGNAVALDPASGNVVVVGRNVGVSSFGGVTLDGGTQGAAFVWSLTAAGGQAFAEQLGGNKFASVTAYAVATDAAGGVTVGGNFDAQNPYAADFDPGPGVFLLDSTASSAFGIRGNGFTAKLTRAGGFVAVRRVGGDESSAVTGVALDPAGRQLVTGFFGGSFISTADFDPSTTGTASLTANNFNTDLFVASLNPVAAATVAGMVTAGGVGVAGAVAELFARTSSYLGNSVEFSLGVAATNSAGRYSFTVPTPDLRYFVRFRLPAGYAFAGVSETAVFTLAPGGLTTQGTTVTGSAPAFGFAFGVTGSGGAVVNASSMARGADGTIFVGGTFTGANVDFDPGPGVYPLSAPDANGDAFAAAYTAAGSLLWVRVFNGGDLAQSLAVDGAGNLYVPVVASGTADLDPGPGVVSAAGGGLVKLDPRGNYLWSYSRGTVAGVGVDPAGNAYLAGTFAGGVDFGTGGVSHSKTAAGSQDLYVAKLDAAGGYLAVTTLGNPGTATTVSGHSPVAVNAAGDVALIGSFTGVLNYAFFVKLDSSLSQYFLKFYRAPEAGFTAVSIDPTGVVLAAGSYRGTVDYSPGTPSNVLTTAAGDEDAVVVKYSAAGDVVFALPFRTSGTNKFTKAWSVASGPSGDVYVGGNFSGTTDFNPGPNDSATTGGGPYLARLSSSGAFRGVQLFAGAGSGAVNGLAFTPSGQVLTAGYVLGVADFDPTAAVYPVGTAGQYTAFVAQQPAPVAAAKVAGTVYGDANGNGVQNGAEVGVAGAVAELLKFNAQTSRYVAVGTAVTDAAGRYTFTVAVPDPLDAYAVRFRAPAGYAGFSAPVGGQTADFTPDFGGTVTRDAGLTLSKALPTFGYATAVGGTQDFESATDAAGNTVVTGRVLLPGFDFDPGPGVADVTGSVDGTAFVASYTPAGALRWVRTLGTATSVGRAVGFDSSGNVVAAGTLIGAADFDPGPGVTAVTGSASGATFVWKLDAAGNLVWVRSIGNSPGLATPRALTIDGGDNVVVAGSLGGGPVDFDPGVGVSNAGTSAPNAFVWKLTGAGDFAWVAATDANQYSTAAAVGVAVDPSNRVYLTGVFVGDVTDFDPGPGAANLTPSGSRDGFLLKLTAAGAFEWVRDLAAATGNDDVFPHAVAADAAGVSVVGDFGGYALFGGGVTLGRPFGPVSGFLARYQADGTPLYAKDIGGAPTAVTLAAGGAAVVAGTTTGADDFDPGPGAQRPASPAAGAFLAQYDAAGNFASVRTTGRGNSSPPVGVGLDAAGNAYLAGNFGGSPIDFNPGPGGTPYPLDGGSGSGYLTRVNAPATPAVALFTVTSTEDSGVGSLRQAILDANASPRGGRIVFQLTAGDANFLDVDRALPGGDLRPDAWRVRPLTDLPGISNVFGFAIALDARTQTAYAQTQLPGDNLNPFGPEVILDGTLLAEGTGFRAGVGVTIAGFAIGNFRRTPANGGGYGIRVLGAGTTITGNYLGTDATGTAAAPNQVGLIVEVATAVVTGNVISGNTGDGANFGAGAVVRGNFIGTDATGTFAVPNDVGAEFGVGTLGGPLPGDGNVISGNSRYGVYAYGGGLIQGNTIGLNAAGDAAVPNGDIGVLVQRGGLSLRILGNLISGNGSAGVSTDAQDGSVIAGNLIGLNRAGTAAIGNTSSGVAVWQQVDVVTGGTLRIGTDGDGLNDAAERNVISGNGGSGVAFLDQNGTVAHAVVVAGNFIGTDATGAFAVPNGVDGVAIQSSPGSTGTARIGGATAATGNVLSGNTGSGVSVGGTGGTAVTIAGNRIGTDAAGTAAVGNGRGVFLDAGAHGVTVGGSAAGAGNLVSGNTNGGVVVAGDANTLLGNVVGLAADGVTPLGNRFAGVAITGSNNAVTGTFSAGVLTSWNTVSGNADYGLVIDVGTGNVVSSTFIGTRADRTGAVGNLGNGVYLFESDGNVVGDSTGTDPLLGNTFAGNTLAAVRSETRNTIRLNRFLGSADPRLDVDVGLAGPTANDAGDADGVPNTPDVTSVTATAIGGTLHTAPNRGVEIDFYADGVFVTKFAGNANPAGFLAFTTATGLAGPAAALTYQTTFVLAGPNYGASGEVGVYAPPPAGPAVTIAGPTGPVKQGTFVRIRSAVADPDPDPTATLRFLWTVTKPGEPDLTSDAAALEFTPTADGLYAVSLTVTNRLGAATTVTLPGGLTVLNVAPVVLAVGGVPEQARTGVPILLTSEVADPGGDAGLSYDWKVFADGRLVATLPDAAAPTYTPPADGIYGFTLTVSDGRGGSGSGGAQAFVTGSAPIARILGAPARGPEGTPILLSAALTSAVVEDALTYSWQVFKNGTPYLAGNERTLALTPDDNGRYVVALRVSLTTADPATGRPLTLTSLATAAVDVFNVRPELELPGVPTDAAVGTPLTLSAAVTDAGPLDLARIAANPGLTQWGVTASNGQVVPAGSGRDFTFTPTAEGTYVVRATARDGDGGQALLAREITVTFRPLGVTAAPLPATSPAGVELTPTATVVAAGGQPLAYRWAVTKDGEPYGQPSSADAFRFTPDGPGHYRVTLGVSQGDGAGNVSVGVASWDVTATPRLSPVNIGGLPTGPTPEGAALHLVADSALPGRSGEISFLWAVTRTGDAAPTATSTRRALDFTPADNGDYAVTLRVTAGGATASASGGFRVLNVAPAVRIAPAPGGAADGSVVSLRATLGDPSATDTAAGFTYFWSVTRDGLPFLAEAQGGSQFQYRPDAARGGRYVVSVRVADKDGVSGRDDALVVAGTAGDDRIVVTPRDLAGLGVTRLVVLGLAGDDLIDASNLTVPVVLDGGDGDDTLLAGSADDLLLGGPGNDSLVGNAGNDTLDGGEGDDTMVGGDGDDQYDEVPGSADVMVEGGDGGGTDTINFAAANRAILGFDLRLTNGEVQPIDPADPDTGHVNTLSLVGLFERVLGSRFGDLLTARSDSTLFGGAGDDTLRADGGRDVLLDGGDGTDALAARGVADATLFGGAGDDSLSADGSAGVSLAGGDGGDRLSTDGSRGVTLDGGDGADSLVALGGADVTLFGGAGDDNLTVSGGRDITLVGGDAELRANPGAAGGLDATLFGGSGDDSLTVSGGETVRALGGDGADRLTVSGGLDVTLFGGAGDDSLTVSGGTRLDAFGGDGNDALAALGGTDITLFGGAGDDRLTADGNGRTDRAVLDGGDGNDALAALGGADVTLFGGAGDDSLTVGGGDRVAASGGDGVDGLTALGGVDVTLFGGAGDDNLTVRGGERVTAYGGDGADSLAALGGVDVTLFGGAGDDSLDADGAAGASLFGGAGSDRLRLLGGPDVSLFGGAGDDDLSATGGTSAGLSGDGGNDRLVALGGADITLFGGAGDDSLTVSGGDRVAASGGDGADGLTATGGLDVTLFGGAGDDSLTVDGADGATAAGNGGADNLRVLSGANATLFGGAGDDTLTVGGGTSAVADGGDGADRLAVLGGVDTTLFGGAGDDTVDLAGGDRVTVYAGAGDDRVGVTAGDRVTVFGGLGDDRLTVAGGSRVTVFGGGGNDNLSVTGGSDVTLFGGAGDDALDLSGGSGLVASGGDGNDALASATVSGATLFGGAGDDTFDLAGGTRLVASGGDGNDALRAVGGSDISLFGGAGDDAFDLTGGDRVAASGGAGNDRLTSAGGLDATLFGGAGDDTLTATSGANLAAYGGDGNDSLSALGGADVSLFGGAGDDSLAASGGDRVTGTGDGGRDRLTVTGGDGVTLYGGAGNDTALVSAGNGVDIYGGAGDDSLTATGGTDVRLFGGDGKDVLVSQGGTELYGGRGDDSLASFGSKHAVLAGEEGSDTYRVSVGGAASVVVIREVRKAGDLADAVEDPVLDTDTIDFSLLPSVTFDMGLVGLTAGDGLLPPALGQSVSANLTVYLYGFLRNAIGTPGDDTIRGNALGNSLRGGGGDDTLYGLGGPDTLEGGGGDDSLVGGAGDDTYRFAGSNLGTDTVVEDADRDSDTLDFSAFTPASAEVRQGVTVNLADPAAQVVTSSADLTLILSSASGVENVVGTPFDDAIRGNARRNRLEGGRGDDTLAGGAGDDTYVFAGSDLGTDVVVEADGQGDDALDFTRLAGPADLDLADTAPQVVSPGVLTLQLVADPAAPGTGNGVETVLGTPYADAIRGNDRDNRLYGGGGRDRLDGRAGDDLLQGGLTQVVYLDFDAVNSPRLYAYTPADRAAVAARLRAVYAEFAFEFTLARPDPADGPFVTVTFNAGNPGGQSSELDYRNLDRGGAAAINVNGFLGGPGQPTLTAANAVGLSAGVAAHELGHLVGLRHSDAFGPIGTGISPAVNPGRYYPGYAGPAAAAETAGHVSASPRAVGSTLFDAAAGVFLGAREAIKLAFADTGTVAAEDDTFTDAAGRAVGNGSARTAQPLGALPGLAVPNTLPAFLPGTATAPAGYGLTFAVGAAVVTGTLTPGDDDFYSFVASPGDLVNVEVTSATNPHVGPAVNPRVFLLDQDGNVLASNDDELESPDATVLDFRLPTAGLPAGPRLYFVVVDGGPRPGRGVTAAGGYELFLSTFKADATTASLGGGDTLVGSPGRDTLVGGSGDDLILIDDAALANTVRSAGAGDNLLDLSGVTDPAAQADYVARLPAGSRVTAVKLAEVSPPDQFPDLHSSYRGTVGAPITFRVTGLDPDAFDRVTYSLEAAVGAYAYPVGATIRAATGEFTWAPTRPGDDYAVVVVATDSRGNATRRLVFLAASPAGPVVLLDRLAPPAIPEAGTLTLGGHFRDPGPGRWAAGVDYGDGVVEPLALNPDDTFTLTHTYSAPGVYAVAVSVTNDQGLTGTQTATVTVTNVAPVLSVTPAGDFDIGQGDSVAFTASFADPGPGSWTLTVDYGDGSDPDSFGASPGDFDGFSHRYTANGDFVVTVTVADDNDPASFQTVTRLVSVRNVAPTNAAVTPSAAAVLEGGAVSLAGTFDAPAGVDNGWTYAWTVSASNGEVVPGGAGRDFAFTPQDNGIYTVQFVVTDRSGGTTSATAVVSAGNVAPTATFAASAAGVTEGGAATVSFAGQFDPSARDTAAGFRYSYDFDSDGTFEVVDSPLAAAPIPARFLADGPADLVVTGVIRDKDGASSRSSATVRVANAPPVASIVAAPSRGTEAAAVALTGAGTDPSGRDEAAGFTYAWAVTRGGVPFASSAASRDPAFAFTPADDGSYAVTLTVTDKDGGVGTAQATVAVTNLAPRVVLAGGPAAGESTEGAALAFAGSATDLSPADGAAGFTYAWAVTRDGAAYLAGAGALAAGVALPIAFTPADNGTYRLTLTVTDKDGGATSASRTVAVRNVAPTVAVGGDATLVVGAVLARDGSFTDPGLADGPWVAAVNTDAGVGGSGSFRPLALTGGTFQLATNYSAPGTYLVTVRVTDKDGGVGTASFSVTVLPRVTASFTAVSPDPRLTPVPSVLVTFSRPIRAASLDLGDFQLARDGVAVPLAAAAGVALEMLTPTTFLLKGLAGLTAAPGSYALFLTAAGVDDDLGFGGTGVASTTWATASATPPALATAVVQSGLTQRSFVDDLRFTFTKPVAFPNGFATAVVLTNFGVNAPIDPDTTVTLSDAQFRYDGTTLFWTLGRDPATNAYRSLPDGYYEWRFVAANVKDLAGNPLTPVAVPFYVLKGDVTGQLVGDPAGSRRVNAANSTTDVTSDLRLVNLALNSTPTSGTWNANADLNRDGRVNVLDRNVVLAAAGRRIVDPLGALSAAPGTPAAAPVAAPLTSNAGAGYAVAVIDTGIDYRHADFAGRVVLGPDFGDRDADPIDTVGHGTQVAGVAAGKLGAAAGATLIALKVTPDGSLTPSEGAIRDALLWVLANRERYRIAAVNLSLGGGAAARGTGGDLAALLTQLTQAGVVVTAAAGNGYRTGDGDGLSTLAADPSVVSVGALDAAGRGLADSSQRGPGLDFVAPGSAVLTPTLGGAYTLQTGTSFAAPNVAGAAAALRAAADRHGLTLSAAELLHLLTATATPVFDPASGLTYHRLDLDAALAALGDLAPICLHGVRLND